MTTLSTATDYLLTQARPLERALYRYHFEDGSQDEVLRALADFQNADGGFGHGLEPDIALADSSVHATSVAFQVMRAVAAPAEHPVVVKACGYLRATYDPARMDWPNVPNTLDNAPHAPWWVIGGDIYNSLANVRAELLGYIYDYAIHFPDDLRRSLTDAVMQQLQRESETMEMHDLLCYLRLYATESLPAEVKRAMHGPLERALKATVATDPAAWQSYGLQPLAVVESLDSPFAALFTEVIPANLDLVVTQQGADGSWQPAWSWADIDAAAWAKAERDWRAVLTLNNVRILRAFGRV